MGVQIPLGAPVFLDTRPSFGYYTNMSDIKEPSISLKDTKEVACSCGNTLFKQGISLREVSALLTGTGRTEYVPMAVIACDKCGKVFERPQLVTG